MNRRLSTFYPYLLLLALNSIWFLTLALPLIHLDDPIFITNNPYVRDGLSLQSFWWACTTSFADYWHPLTWISLSLDATLFGNHPWSYHLTNTLLHLVNTLLVFSLFRYMTGNVGRSLLAAILFSLHPERVESVAWATERKDVLSACLGLLAVLAYFRYVRAPNAGRYLLICVLFFLAFLAKPLLVTFPGLLLLLDFWPLNRLSRANLWPLLKEKIPFVLLAVDGAVNTYMQVLTKGSLPGTASSSIQNCIMNYFFYVRNLFCPAWLSLYYRAPASFPLWQLAAAAAVLLAITTIVLLRLYARAPYARPLFVGWFWFLIAMLPMSGILQAGYSMRGDRFTYIPVLGLILALLWGVVPAIRFARRPVPAIAIACLITAGLMLGTVNRLLEWRDPLTLYQHDLALDEQNAYLHELVGLAAADRHMTDLANEHFRRAIELDPADLIYRPLHPETQPRRPAPPN